MATATIERPKAQPFSYSAATSDITAETLNAYILFRDNPMDYAEQALPDAVKIKIDSIVIGERTIPTINVLEAKTDSTLILDRTALAKLQAKVILKEYPDMRMASGEIIPIDYGNDGVTLSGSGVEIIETIQIDRVGAMAAISDYSNGGPAVDLIVERAFQFVKLIGSQANWSMFELKKLASGKIPLKSAKLDALKESFMRYIDRGGYFGDSQIGLQGLLTINGTSEYASPSAFSTALPADQMLAILANMANTISDNTNGIEKPKRLVTTERVLNAAIHTRRPNSSKTVYEEFMDVERSIGRIDEWIVDQHLKGADTDGSDIALLLPWDMEKLCLKIVQPFTMLEEQLRGFGYTIHAFASTGLVICPRPRSILRVYGL